VSIRTLALSAVFLCSILAFAKDKKQAVLPEFVLQAQSVAIIGDPDEKISITNPNDQKQALNAVEEAFTKWGRLSPTNILQDADLVVLVRKARPAGAVAAGDPNDRPVILQPNDNGGRIAINKGPVPTGTADPPNTGVPGTGMESGSTQDLFQVYRGHQRYPLDSTPIWSYVARNALNPPSPAAVEQFRKAIEASEKAKKDPNKP
jgi:hypothetical protein